MRLATSHQANSASLAGATTVSRRAAMLAIVALFAAAIVSLTATDAVNVRAGRLASGDLEALIGQTWTPVGVGDVIPGEVDLRTSDGAVVGLGGGAVELRPRATGRRVADSFDLSSGTLVVEDERLVTLTSNLVELSGRGLWRADAAVPSRVVVYAGLVVARDAGGRAEDVQRGEQLGLVTSRIQQTVAPLRYVSTDAVDARILADAIAVDQFLDATAIGLEADYGTAPQVAAFYEDFDTLDGVVVEALAPLALQRIGQRFGPPTAVLTAAVVTESLVTGAGLTPVEAATEVGSARRAGSAYGLVTWLRDVSPSVVRAAAGRALTQRRTLVAAGEGAQIIDPPAPVGPLVGAPASPAPSSAPTTATANPAEPSPTATPPTPTPTPTPSPTPTPTTPSPEPTGTVGGVVSDVEEVTGPLEDVVGEDLGQVVDETVELVDELLEELPVVGSLLAPSPEAQPGTLLGP